jgi:hypothetical protein
MSPEGGRRGLSRAQEHDKERELANLKLPIVAINGWNRLNMAFRKEAGSDQPARSPKA